MGQPLPHTLAVRRRLLRPFVAASPPPLHLGGWCCVCLPLSPPCAAGAPPPRGGRGAAPPPSSSPGPGGGEWDAAPRPARRSGTNRTCLLSARAPPGPFGRRRADDATAAPLRARRRSRTPPTRRSPALVSSRVPALPPKSHELPQHPEECSARTSVQYPTRPSLRRRHQDAVDSTVSHSPPTLVPTTPDGRQARPPGGCGGPGGECGRGSPGGSLSCHALGTMFLLLFRRTGSQVSQQLWGCWPSLLWNINVTLLATLPLGPTW